MAKSWHGQCKVKKTLSRQSQGNVKAGKNKVKVTSRQGKSRVKAVCMKGQGKVNSCQGDIKARSRQRKHNLNLNRIYNLMGFNTIEITLVVCLMPKQIDFTFLLGRDYKPEVIHPAMPLKHHP